MSGRWIIMRHPWHFFFFFFTLPHTYKNNSTNNASDISTIYEYIALLKAILTPQEPISST